MSSCESKRGAVRCGAFLFAMLLASAGRAADPGVTLPDAVRQAIASNLDLAARRQALAAAHAEIGMARSVLLPQLEIGARAQLLDSDRADSDRGNNKQESVLLAAGLSQILYDEQGWAGFETQKHVYAGQMNELEAFELAVVQDAAVAFLELDRERQVLEIQQRNREYTRRNLETSRSRIAAGWSGEREILRWEVQLASNDTDTRAAQVGVLQNRFELNRVRNRAPESEVSVLPATLREFGFLYARPAIAEATATPEQDRRIRDFLARVGLRRSPDLAALDASIAAAERQLLASRRAFWVPTLSLGAGVDYLTNSGSGDDFNETEWGLKGVLSFPLFRGGAKFAGLDQAREALASLRTQRSSSAQFLEESIRATLAQASGSFANVGFTTRQIEAARRNFELVDASYTLGVATILDLLDAQAQLLTGELALVTATIGFLEDLIAAERAISFYAFLESSSDVDALLSQLEQELGLQP